MPHIDFRFYNDGHIDHELLFTKQVKKKCPQYLNKISELLNKGITAYKMEFYTYALFEDFNSNNPNLSSFNGFNQIARGRKRELDCIYEISKTFSFRYRQNVSGQIAYAGCGAALIVANRLFDLTNADYIRIPEKPGRPKAGTIAGANKTLDFEYLASDGSRLLRVECKGKEGLDGSIANKANSIIDKKQAAPKSQRDLRFGIIHEVPVLPDTRNSLCTLVDPDIPDSDIDPLLFKLSARLRYYTHRLGFLGNTKWVKDLRNLFDEEDSYLIRKRNVKDSTFLATLIGEEDAGYITSGYHFKLCFITLDDDGAYVRVTRLENTNNEYFVYGLSMTLFQMFQNGTVKDLLNYRMNEKEILFNDWVKVWDEYLEKEETFLSGKLTICSTGEILGTLKQG